MAYDKSDPRASLAASAGAPAAGAVAEPEYFDFLEIEPTEHSEGGSLTWFARGQNMVVALTRYVAGDRIQTSGIANEYAIIITEDSATVQVQAGQDSITASGLGVVVVPPGDSVITSERDCTVVRLFDAQDETINALAMNADSYQQPHPRVTLTESWPEPVGGRKLRAYALRDFPPEEGRFGAIFRTSNLMINFIDPQVGPRDVDKLSPHSHDDFEQCSLAVEGIWLHHIRTPWFPEGSQWREDDHEVVGSPSVTIIPPPTVHTSAAIGSGINRLIDIFAPPRVDFSEKGWVLNAADYPAPWEVQA